MGIIWVSEWQKKDGKGLSAGFYGGLLACMACKRSPVLNL